MNEKDIMIVLIFSLCVFGLFIFFIYAVSQEQKKRYERIQAFIRGLENNSLEITPEQFFSIRNGSLKSQLQDFTGVYILHNTSKDMYYVGQGKSVFKRVNAHFTGHGNGDIYADYKYGDEFTIRMISLVNSGFNNLDELERNTIMAYDAYNKGYNRTRGNRG